MIINKLLKKNLGIKNLLLKTLRYNFQNPVEKITSIYYTEKLEKSTFDVIIKKDLKKINKLILEKDEKNLEREIRKSFNDFLRLYSYGRKIKNLLLYYNFLNSHNNFDFRKEKIIIGKNILLKIKSEEIKEKELIFFLENFFEFLLKNKNNFEIRMYYKDINFFVISENFINNFNNLKIDNDINLYIEQFYIFLKYMIIFEKNGFILKRGLMMEISYKFENLFLNKKKFDIEKKILFLEILNFFQELSILTNSKKMDNFYIRLFKKINFEKIDKEKKKKNIF